MSQKQTNNKYFCLSGSSPTESTPAYGHGHTGYFLGSYLEFPGWKRDIFITTISWVPGPRDCRNKNVSFRNWSNQLTTVGVVSVTSGGQNKSRILILKKSQTNPYLFFSQRKHFFMAVIHGVIRIRYLFPVPTNLNPKFNHAKI